MPSKTKKPTSFHWGSYYAEIENEKIVGMRPYENDKDPSKIANGIINSVDDELRIRVPHVRKGYLREIRKELANSKMALTGKRSREKRGSDKFVTVSWDEAIDIVAFELNRVKKKYQTFSAREFSKKELPKFWARDDGFGFSCLCERKTKMRSMSYSKNLLKF